MESATKGATLGENPRHRVLFLDVLRVFSLLLIICYHFDAGINDVHPGAHIVGKLVVLRQSVGDIGVALFIMISGAALMLRNEDAFDAVKFFKKRFLAIFPPYWVCYLAISIFLFFLRGSAQGRSEYWKFLLTLFALDGYFGTIVQNDYYLIGEWFVGFILIMYLLFPLLRAKPYRHPIISGAVMLAAIGILGHYYSSSFPIGQIRNPLMRLPDFFFGMCFIRYIYPKMKFVLPLAIAALLAYASWGAKIPSAYASLIVATSLFCIVGFLAERVPAKNFLVPYIARASRLSFIAFLVHHWVIYLSLDRIDASRLSTVEVYYLFAIVVGFSFGIAALLEKPVSSLTDFLSRQVFYSRATS